MRQVLLLPILASLFIFSSSGIFAYAQVDNAHIGDSVSVKIGHFKHLFTSDSIVAKETNGLITITTDSQVYSHGSTVKFSGTTTDTSDDISLEVIAANGNVVTIDQIVPSANGSYSGTLGIGALWAQDGSYTIKVSQGDQVTTASATVTVGQVVPEFGPIASIILAIAVMSMVVFAAKTKSIPRY